MTPARQWLGWAGQGAARRGGARHGMETYLTHLDERCRRLERQLVVERDINRELRERLACLVGDLDLEANGEGDAPR